MLFKGTCIKCGQAFEANTQENVSVLHCSKCAEEQIILQEKLPLYVDVDVVIQRSDDKHVPIIGLWFRPERSFSTGAEACGFAEGVQQALVQSCSSLGELLDWLARAGWTIVRDELGAE